MSAKRILFATLNWGLGHSTRSISLIRHLRAQGHQLFLASDGAAGLLLQKEFSDLPYFNLPATNIQYSSRSFYQHWALLAFHLFKNVEREKKMVKDLMRDYQFDIIISDNRYGIQHPDSKNIFLTHQLTFDLPQPLKTLVQLGIRRYVNRFDQCWIPDFAECTLSGMLSQGSLKISKKYIGPLSRFSPEQRATKYDVAVLISGPEPFRKIFYDQLSLQLRDIDLKMFWVLGLPQETSFIEPTDSRQIFNHLPSQQLNHMLNQTKVVISRAGYSSIMDFYILGKKAILIPTPLQPEQQYLARWHKNRRNVYVPQPDLQDLKSGLLNLLQKDVQVQPHINNLLLPSF